jgi:hypothetical protein
MSINRVARQDGRKLADIAIDHIEDWLRKPDCFVWVALRDATDDELSQMQQEFGLHELAVEDARHGYQRPRNEAYGPSLFVVMKPPEARRGEPEIGEVAIFVGPGLRAPGAQQQPAGLHRRARTLRARARAPAAGRGRPSPARPAFCFGATNAPAGCDGAPRSPGTAIGLAGRAGPLGPSLRQAQAVRRTARVQAQPPRGSRAGLGVAQRSARVP